MSDLSKRLRYEEIAAGHGSGRVVTGYEVALPCGARGVGERAREGHAMTGLAVVKGSTALAPSNAIKLNGIEDVFRLAADLSKADGFIPAALLGKPASIAAAIMTALEMNIGVMEALRNVSVIKGKVTFDATYLLALMHRAGIRTEWLSPDGDKTEAKLLLTRHATGEKHVAIYTIEMARDAGLAGGDNWKKNCGQMLRRRATTKGLREFCPEVTLGPAYTPDELDDRPAGSTGSADVRDLGAALHDDPEPTGAHAVPADLAARVERAMTDLTACRSADDVHGWIDTYASTISEQPASTAKSAQWKEIQRRAAGVTPPVRSDALTRAFGAVLMRAKAAKPDVVEGITEDGEVTPGARALTELQSVETAEAAHAWLNDNRDYLAGIGTGTSEERIVWAAIRKRVGDECADAMEASLS